MRFRTVAEATAFIKALLEARKAGQREFMTASLDSVPQWQAGKTPSPALDGSRIVAVYMAYKEPTARQKKQAQGAKLAGVSLQQIEGRLVDVRTVSDGTTQVLFTNGLRNADGSVPFRGPNVDKGILCYLAIDEGLGEPVEDIIARVPEEMKAKLKALKEGTAKLDLPTVDLAAVVAGEAQPTQAPAQAPAQTEPNRLKLK